MSVQGEGAAHIGDHSWWLIIYEIRAIFSSVYLDKSRLKKKIGGNGKGESRYTNSSTSESVSDRWRLTQSQRERGGREKIRQGFLNKAGDGPTEVKTGNELVAKSLSAPIWPMRYA